MLSQDTRRGHEEAIRSGRSYLEDQVRRGALSSTSDLAVAMLTFSLAQIDSPKRRKAQKELKSRMTHDQG